MIEGHDTRDASPGTPPEPRLPTAPLYPSGPAVSRAGFGGYRIASGVPSHDAALEDALLRGISLVDTSANYADGESERLVGEVLRRLIDGGRLSREDVVVVSKAGYLQGRNLEVGRRRAREGRPFPERVEISPHLEHCIHPDFLSDQLTRSLERLGLETLDAYLLHNPEYYLSWARREGIDRETARRRYHDRIRRAFEHLEGEVAAGRIRCFGISSNTFPSPPDDPDATCLSTVIETARAVSSNSHFRVIQLPMNLLETGAASGTGRPGGATLLDIAAGAGLGVLVNRPLNAFSGGRLVRLADPPAADPPPEAEIRRRIERLAAVEAEFPATVLPVLGLPREAAERVAAAASWAEALRQGWRSAGSLEAWEHWLSTRFLPAVRGLAAFLDQRLSGEDPGRWRERHREALSAVLDGVGAHHAAAAAQRARAIASEVRRLVPEWSPAGCTLSQTAVRALRSTRGVGCVLVGMRSAGYVDDVAGDLCREVPVGRRREIWRLLPGRLEPLAAGP